MNKRPVVLLLVAVSLFLIATTIKSGWLYLVSSALVALVLLGVFSGWRSTRKIEIERSSAHEVFEGDALTVRLKVSNKARGGKYFLTLTDLQFLPSKREIARELRVSSGQILQTWGQAFGLGRHRVNAAMSGLTTAVGIEKLGSNESLDLNYQLNAARRGVYPDSRLEVSSSGIFESVKIRRTRTFPSELVVYPKTSPMESFPFTVVDYASSVKPFESSRKGTGLDYFGVRDYSPGDSMKHIHWKSSAKQGKLIVREYQHEYQHSLGILLLLQKPRFGDLANNSLEDGLRIAASIVRHLEMTGGTPWLAFPEGNSMEVLEHSGPYEIMRTLAEYETPVFEGEDLRPGLKQGVEFLAGAGVPMGPLAVITNISPGELALELGGIFELEGNSIVHVLDESYGGARAKKSVAEDLEGLTRSASLKTINLFQHKNGGEIGECLKEPLNVIAA